MALFTVTENDRRIWETELRDFVPENMFDVHTHVYLEGMKTWHEGASVRTVAWPEMVARDDSIEDLQETFRLLYPGKKVKALMFSTGSCCGKHAEGEGNRYISESIKKSGFYGLYYSNPGQSGEEIERLIREGGFVGLKSFLNLCPEYIPEAETRIFDFFTPDQLKTLNKMGAIMMLHLPRNGRLKDPVNLAQLIEIREKYPDVRMIIAHVGRAYTQFDVGNAFEVLKGSGLEFMIDFSANCSEYAITKAIETFGPKNIMYGTDMPILRMRCHRIEENNTYINLIPPGMYGDPAQDRHLREVSPEEAEKITFFAYEELLAFKRASEKLGLSRADIEDIMCNNAQKLVDDAHKSIYG